MFFQPLIYYFIFVLAASSLRITNPSLFFFLSFLLHSSDSLMELKATESNNDLKKKNCFQQLPFPTFHFSYIIQPWLPKSFSSAISSKVLIPLIYLFNIFFFPSCCSLLIFYRSRRLPINIYTA